MSQSIRVAAIKVLGIKSSSTAAVIGGALRRVARVLPKTPKRKGFGPPLARCRRKPALSCLFRWRFHTACQQIACDGDTARPASDRLRQPIARKGQHLARENAGRM